uniref:Uncharacterized protein n=1 Tax=Ananas comosus var. bracteatus TaxID=296719 RepID=A0A6V7Q4M6_ANACO|nr:unnamed protein product [Ananas comosus var. bracteatus]
MQHPQAPALRPNPDVLAALQGSNLLVSYGIKNQDLAAIAGGVDRARSWVDQFYVPYQNLNVAEIVVGNEVVPGDLARYVVPAMRNLHAAFRSSNFSITITTAISSAALTDTYPPSHSAFTNGAISVMAELVGFLKSSGMPRSMLYVHLYPYFAYAADPANVRRDYALFEAREPVVVDGNLTYYNLFDAMYDGFAWAMEKIGGEGVQLVVGETGWPTPKNPNKGLGGVLAFALFDEDRKPAGVEQNFGLYYPSMQPVYSSPFSC